ncbi:hypothetical protein [Hymenobacter cellulosivorans]|uniref:Uncharacterized protein n=1 Tax=Hymenobacter cellulosivorans TaxID=2932249 RepID=A0ABY4F8Y5_9BACT|nr:hypothetical protein [Hymenobacter cellulosivorans]UOQ53121.1 hypothetical protein MUN80_25730 [Hymenobacter cellulosivorans]
MQHLSALILIIFALSVGACRAQAQYVGHYTLKSRPKSYTLVDEESGTRFLLDSSRVFITAIDKNGKKLWRTDPYTAAKVEAYRVKRPEIVYFSLSKAQHNESPAFRKGDEVTSVGYNNTVFGLISKETGIFFYLGQD